MNTKVILHGGYGDHQNDQNNDFFREILKDTPDEVNVLLVLFAKEKSEYPKKEKVLIDQFKRNSGQKILSFKTATLENFTEEIAGADVIYLHGGNTLKLLEVMKQHDSFKDLIEGKVVVGESAGAYVLSACFFSKTIGEVREGVGLVPVKLICHYADKNTFMLKKCSDDLESILLADYEYEIFRI